MADLLGRLVDIDSPSNVPEAGRAVREILGHELTAVGWRHRTVGGVGVGAHLLGVPLARRRHRPVQLVLGHLDTVWPLGEARTRAASIRDGRLSGPGSFDMKGGLVQLLFALGCLNDLGLHPAADVVVFVNSDEEIGSPDSRRWIDLLARLSSRAFVLEGAYGTDGALKVGRKGVGRYELRVKGVAAHSGLDPGAGASAVLEIAQQIQRLFEMNDASRGTTVNVGTVDGGLRPNVIAPTASAQIEVRVSTVEDGERIDAALRALTPVDPDVELSVTGGFARPPMEASGRNLHLWDHAERLAAQLGLAIDRAVVGGASDGNLTSVHTATLDGLGAVGDGAHRLDEHVVLDTMPERAALLALLLLCPLDAAPATPDDPTEGLP